MSPKNILFIIVFLFLSTNTQAQQTLNETITLNNIARNYTIYIPEMYDGNTAVPLLFNFHGFTGSAENQLTSTRMRPVADTAGFIIVYPQGALLFGDTHWNVGSWTKGSTADDLGFTDAMINALSAKYNIDENRVYSCGYSNGGYFSFELACQLSHRIAAIGAVGGKMSSETFNACMPLHPIPVITIHGTEDNVVTYEGPKPLGSKSISEVNTYWTNFNNTNETPLIENLPNTNTSDGSTVEYHSYSNGDNCSSVVHYKVIGGGHDWPGSWGNKDIDASSVIWNFVSQYDINGLINCELTTPIEELTRSQELLLYPNPTNGLVTVQMEVLEEVPCHIYSIEGQRLFTTHIDLNKKTIDVSGLSANIYLLQIGDKVVKLVTL